MVVDDEESVRAVASSMLQNAGLSVITAKDGNEAVDLFRRRSGEISAILLDLTMPNMDGIEAFREIRRITENVPVILCSGYNEQDAIVHFADKGLSGYLQKPYRYNTLTEIIIRVLKRRCGGSGQSKQNPHRSHR